MSKLVDTNENENENLNKRRKLNKNLKIQNWKGELILFSQRFEKIIIHNIYDCFEDNNLKARKIVDTTNFFSSIDDLPHIMPLINSIIKNNEGIKRYIVYITILFLYYGLVLLDQTYNFLYTSDIKKWFNISNEENDKIYELIIEISCSDKIYAKNIRKNLFNIND